MQPRADLIERLPGWARAMPDGVYLVGGALRDLLRGEELGEEIIADWDLLAIGEVATQSAVERLSAAFGRPPVILGQRAPDLTWRFVVEGEIVDLVTAADLETDLLRRDFTINALALHLADGSLADPFDGLGDLDRHLIRMTSPAVLEADPLRLLRAHRFAACLDFTIESATASAIAAGHASIEKSALERITVELDKLLGSVRSAPQLTAMRENGLLLILLPELAPLDGLGQNQYHHADVLTHVLEAVAAADGLDELVSPVGAGFPAVSPADFLFLKWAVLLHDLGKAATRTEDADGSVHFYGHEIISEKMVQALGPRLRFSSDRTQRLARLARFHLRLLFLHKNPPGRAALRRLVRDLDDDLPLLIALALADKAATRGPAAAGTLAAIAALSAQVLAVHAAEHHELKNLPKLIDGLRACELLGIRPGRELGKAMDALMDEQVAGRISTPEQAEEFFRAMAGAAP